MSNLVIPTDYAWNTWSASNISDYTTYFTQTVTTSDGVYTAPNAGYDAVSGYVWDRLDWIAQDGYTVAVEARTADTSAALTSATYFNVQKDCTFLIGYRKRFIQPRITISVNADGSSPKVYFMSLYCGVSEEARQYETAGLTKDSNGANPTYDGVFQGRLYQCGICGMTFRKIDMVTQRGLLVCRKNCKDLEKTIPSAIQVRHK